MRVVVTGASGFLGRAVVRELRSHAGVEVVALSRREHHGTTRVRDYSEAPRGDVLIHLAQEAERGKVNAAGAAAVQGAVETARALVAKRHARLLFASSGAVYAAGAATPRGTGDPVSASDAYARMKLESEREFQEAGGVAVRLANLYGPGISPATVLGTILSQIPGAGPLRVHDLLPVRDFLWLDDAAAGFGALALGGFGLPAVAHLSTGVGSSIGEVARLALNVAGESSRGVVAISPGQQPSALVLDPAATTALCRWTPRTSLREGLTNILQHATT